MMAKNIKVGTKIIVTDPDSVTLDQDAHEGDVGKVVHIHTDQLGTKRYLTYNPKWRLLDDGEMRGLGYSGLFIVLWEREFEVLE